MKKSGKDAVVNILVKFSSLPGDRAGRIQNGNISDVGVRETNVKVRDASAGEFFL